VILLSLALVLASAVALAWGMFGSSDPLIWVSLAAGLGAIALVAGSVVRHRRQLEQPTATAAGPATAGSVAVGSASAGVDPAPSPTPSRSTPAAAPPPAAGPVSPPGDRPAQQWPWTTTPPGGSPDADPRSGWTGPVPAVQPPATDPAPAGVEPGGTPAVPTAYGAPDAGAPAHGPESPPETPWTAGAGPEAADRPPAEPGEPDVEQLPVRDALRVAQLPDEVVVLDGHPRYHLAGCPTLGDAHPVPVAVSAARRGGFTPCAVCRPDATLLARSRARTGQRAGHPAADPTAEWPDGDGQQL
jgi:hypothetical protein